MNLRLLNYSIIITLIILASCGSDSSKKAKETMESKIIHALNQENHEEAFRLIETASKNDPNNKTLLYYKAQAHSLKANIDIYTLFPLMKMKLFSVAMSEWNSLKEFTKKQDNLRDAVVWGEDRDLSSLENLEKIKQEIIEMNYEDITYNTTLEIIYEHTDAVTTSTVCDFTVSVTSDLFSNKFDNYVEYHSELLLNNETCKEFANRKIAKKNYKPIFKGHILREIDAKIADVVKRDLYQKYFTAIFALYDSIPLIKKAPVFHIESYNDIEYALEILKDLKNNSSNRLKENSKKQLGLLAGHLIIGSIRKSYKIDEIERPLDLVCNVIPEVLVSHYPYFLTGFKYMLEAITDSEFEKKNYKNLEKISEFLNELPQKPTQEQENKLFKSIQSFIDYNC